MIWPRAFILEVITMTSALLSILSFLTTAQIPCMPNRVQLRFRTALLTQDMMASSTEARLYQATQALFRPQIFS